MLLLAALGAVTLGVAWTGGRNVLVADQRYSRIIDNQVPNTIKIVRVLRT